MQSLLYTAIDLAAILRSMDLGCQKEAQLIDSIWKDEKPFIPAEYRTNQKKFFLDIQYWLHYFDDKPLLDREFPAIQKDFASMNHSLSAEQFTSDYRNLDLFFKSVRIRILSGGGNSFVRIKLRTLLAQYGYKRRSQLLMQHIEKCLLFYHLEPSLRGGEPCNIAEIPLDRMLTFRVV